MLEECLSDYFTPLNISLRIKVHKRVWIIEDKKILPIITSLTTSWKVSGDINQFSYKALDFTIIMVWYYESCS
jgi:hypothetical protein